MEAATLKPKKQFKKGKLKKTMKNIICRPDIVFWPLVAADENEKLIEALNIIKVDIPNFKKPLWSEISQIQKDLRPKPPPIPKVEGLMFGMTECQKSIDSKDCGAVLIEAAVNPKTIVQPLIESCIDKSVPVLCLKELRNITKKNFGISTSVLGLKQNCLREVQQKILGIYQSHKYLLSVNSPMGNIAKNSNLEEVVNDKPELILCPYLYRTDENVRVFNPAMETEDLLTSKSEQNFIKVSTPSEAMDMDIAYKKMIIKKVASNPNRRKVAKASSND